MPVVRDGCGRGRFGRFGARWGAVLVIVALVAAACGSGGNGQAGDEGQSAGGGSATTAAGGGGAGLSGGGFCEKAAEVAAAEGRGGDVYGDLVDSFDELVDIAPGEIRDDLVVMRDFFAIFADAAASGETPQPSDADQAAFEAASDRVDAYVRDTCGIDTDPERASGAAGADAGASDPFAAQTGTLRLDGTYQTSGEFTGLELECDYLADEGVLTVGLLPEADDAWGVGFTVFLDDGLTPGTYDIDLEASGVPDPDSDDVVFLDTDQPGTATITDVGDPHTVDDQPLQTVTGTYTATDLYDQATGEPAGSIDGTFRCEAYVTGTFSDTLDTGQSGTGRSIDGDTGFVADAGGTLADRYSGGTVCFISDGEFQLDLIPDQPDPVTFQFTTDAFTEPGTYVGTATITATDGSGDRSETHGQVIVDTLEPQTGTGFVLIGGTLNAGFTEGPFGPVGFDADWRCVVSQDELAGAQNG